MFFQRARVRFIRYEGKEAKVGTQMNVIKDIIFTGRILEMVEKTIAFVRTQIREHTYLGKDARFVTEQEYPEFVWKELIVNAITHRDYSIKGTDIQIKMFDDHMTVESPGVLPGIVRIDNMREIHFSRNPKIAEFLHEYEYVREFGEGIDRMYRKMQEAKLPMPKYRTEAFMVYATLRNKAFFSTPQDTPQDDTNQKIYAEILSYCKVPRSKSDIVKQMGYKDIRYFTRKYIEPLIQSGELTMTMPDKPQSKYQKYITL